MAITSLTRWATDAVASLPSTAIFGRGLMKDLRADRLQDLLQRGMPQNGRFAAGGPARAARRGAGREILARLQAVLRAITPCCWYSLSLYWIFRVLMRRSAAARDVLPPMDSSVRRIA